ncbi:MAG: DUF2779 domain-containing protein [Candidatus Coproplasma sp.]
MNFSKSKYCSLWQCPKMCWLKKYKPEEAKTDPAVEARFEAGSQVGELAKGLFGAYYDVTTKKADGSLNLSAMIAKTKKAISFGVKNICEAAFSFGGLYCAVDILHKENGGYAIYEVKSSTDVNYIYCVDTAYQKYVLQKCGVPVTGVYVVNIDSTYVRQGELEINKLFKITDILQLVQDEEKVVEQNLVYAEKMLADPNEPDFDIDMRCNEPYVCSYWDYCTKHIPTPSVFDLYRLPFKDKIASYKKGIVSFENMVENGVALKGVKKMQVDYALNDRGTYIDKAKIKEFLDGLTYPLYFLDFETMQQVIPQFDNSKPYQQIPFQYSLHYIECEGGEVKHKEFLAQSGVDPRREIAESLCNDIPDDVCVLAYNKAFECTRIDELAKLFPDLGEHLLKIKSNIKDLLTPFQNGYYYNRAMGGSFSIKSVLPAIFPDDPELNYHNLEGVHNGSEAMEIFPKIKDMPPEEAEKARENLLEYCKLDTLAMVKVWQELIRVVN